MDEDWLQWLRLAGTAAGAANGVMGGGGLTMPGAGATPTPSVTPDLMPPPGGTGLTGPTLVPPPGPPPVMPNAGLPATTDPNAKVSFPPTGPSVPMMPPGTGPLSTGPSPVPPTPGAPPGGYPPLPPPVQLPGATPPGGTPPATDPTQKTWWDRNIGDPLNDLWKGDGKDSKLTDRQKSLLNAGSSIGAALTKSATPTAPPAIGGGGGQLRQPVAFDASRLAAARVAEMQAIKAKATLTAPWLQRYRQGGGGLLG